MWSLVRCASIREDLITCASKMTSDQRDHAELCLEHLLTAEAELGSRRQKLSVRSDLLAMQIGNWSTSACPEFSPTD